MSDKNKPQRINDSVEKPSARLTSTGKPEHRSVEKPSARISTNIPPKK